MRGQLSSLRRTYGGGGCRLIARLTPGLSSHRICASSSTVWGSVNKCLVWGGTHFGLKGARWFQIVKKECIESGFECTFLKFNLHHYAMVWLEEVEVFAGGSPPRPVLGSLTYVPRLPSSVPLDDSSLVFSVISLLCTYMPLFLCRFICVFRVPWSSACFSLELALRMKRDTVARD